MSVYTEMLTFIAITDLYFKMQKGSSMNFNTEYTRTTSPSSYRPYMRFSPASDLWDIYFCYV